MFHRFDVAECVMLRILEGAYQKLAPSFDFISLLNRMPATGGGNVKSKTFSILHVINYISE